MSTHKHIDRICIIITVIALIATVVFMFGEKIGITKTVDEDSEAHESEAVFTKNDLDCDWDRSDACIITLAGDTVQVDGTGAYPYNGGVYISEAGSYVISGTLTDGSITVSAHDASKVWIYLDGVSVYCSDDAAFIVDQADKVFVTLADGSENTFESGGSYSDEALADNTSGVIFSHDDLTINGTGSLDITGTYKHGIDCNDSLVITGGNITITAAGDGMHANDGVSVTGADIRITAEDDGINAGDAFVSAGGSIDIDGCYEGIEALTVDITGGDITIACSDDGINANGGSSMFGAAGPMGGGHMGGVPYSGKGGSAPGEGMPDGSGGGEHPQRPDDGQRPQKNGDGQRPQKSEGGQWPQMNGDGQRPQMPGDNERLKTDSDTAASEDNENEETWIHISGGNITITNATGRDADGLDSNGDIIITGGNILISLTDSGNNCAIDHASESGGVCQISGGTVIACGNSSMAEGFDDTSQQSSILYTYREGFTDGSKITVTDETGNTLLSWEVPYSFSSVVISHPDMVSGKTYNVTVGDMTESLTAK